MGGSTLDMGEMSSPEEKANQQLLEYIASHARLTREQLVAVADGLLEGYQWRGDNGFVWEETVEPGLYDDQIVPLTREIMSDPDLPGRETVYFAGRIRPGDANNRIIDLDISAAANQATFAPEAPAGQ